VGTRQTCGVARHDHARGVVIPVGGAGESVIVPAGSDNPIVPEPNPRAGADGFQVLARELIGQSEVVVDVGLELIESTVHAIMWIAVS